MSELPKVIRTREELIDTHLSDDDIVCLLDAMKKLALTGDVNATRLLLDFKYGRNPEPPSEHTPLSELLLETPLSTEPLDSM